MSATWVVTVDDKIRRSRKQENDGAKRFGGTVNARSGAGDVRKNDVRTETESIEFKTTTKQSYSLKYSDLYHAWQYATMDSRTMLFGIEFTNLQGSRSRRYIVLGEDDYLALREERDLYEKLAGKLGTLVDDEEFERLTGEMWS